MSRPPSSRNSSRPVARIKPSQERDAHKFSPRIMVAGAGEGGSEAAVRHARREERHTAAADSERWRVIWRRALSLLFRCCCLRHETEERARDAMRLVDTN